MVVGAGGPGGYNGQCGGLGMASPKGMEKGEFLSVGVWTVGGVCFGAKRRSCPAATGAALAQERSAPPQGSQNHEPHGGIAFAFHGRVPLQLNLLKLASVVSCASVGEQCKRLPRVTGTWQC